MKANWLSDENNELLEVDIYFNLIQKCWSIRHKGRVVGHADYLSVLPIKFHVNESGSNKVKETKQKNVHAYVRGYLTSVNEKRRRSGVEISYDPFTSEFFFETESGEEVFADEFKELFFDVDTRKFYGKRK